MEQDLIPPNILIKFSSIKELVIGRKLSLLSNQQWNKIIEILKRNKNLHSIRIFDQEIGIENAIFISTEILRKSSTLKTLNLYNLKIGDLEAQTIANALVRNKSLENLFLANNKIGDTGAIAIAFALQNNSIVKCIKLDFNQISNDGAIAFAESLKKNTSLMNLDLSYQGLQNYQVYQGGFQVHSLYQFRDNTIDEIGAVSIAQALKKQKSLTSLNLSGNKIGAEGGISFAKSLKKNKKLTNLDLSCNDIGDKGAKSLYHALLINKTLKKLDLEGNYVNNHATQYIIRGLQENISLTSYRGLHMNPTSPQSKNLVRILTERNIALSCHYKKIEEIYQSCLEGIRYIFIPIKSNQASIFPQGVLNILMKYIQCENMTDKLSFIYEKGTQEHKKQIYECLRYSIFEPYKNFLPQFLKPLNRNHKSVIEKGKRLFFSKFNEMTDTWKNSFKDCCKKRKRD